jgi:quercetin dioxygenase-like cupin family protein
MEFVPSSSAPTPLPDDRMTAFLAESEDGLDVIVPNILYRKEYEGQWLRTTVTLYRGGEKIHTATPLVRRDKQDAMILVKKGEIVAFDEKGTQLSLKAGDTYAVPAGTAAGMHVKGKGDVILISVSNVHTVGKLTEMLHPYNAYRAARIVTLPTGRISQVALRDMVVDVPGKVLRRVWRMTYLDGWTFNCPSNCNDEAPEHSHMGDELVFNYVGTSRLWSPNAPDVVVGDLQAFFTPYGISHGGKLLSPGEMMIMSIYSPHRESSAGDSH